MKKNNRKKVKSMDNKLEYEKIEKIIDEYKTKDSIISILVKDFEGNVIVEYNPNIKANSASCIKVAIMVAVLKKIQTKELNLNQVLEFENTSLAYEKYDGIYNEIEKKASILELLTFMIINSDNLATNILIDLLGFDYYNNFFLEIGLQDTKLNRMMGIYNLNKENYTSNKDMYHLYKQLLEEKILNKELCKIAKSILHKQRSKTLSQRYIYEDIEVYHKTGALSYLNLRNDCGCFITNNKTYYFGFFLEQMASKEEASILIGKLFKLIYKSLT